jgi:hypothetical protein
MTRHALDCDATSGFSNRFSRLLCIDNLGHPDQVDGLSLRVMNGQLEAYLRELQC